MIIDKKRIIMEALFRLSRHRNTFKAKHLARYCSFTPVEIGRHIIPSLIETGIVSVYTSCTNRNRIYQINKKKLLEEFF